MKTGSLWAITHYREESYQYSWLKFTFEDCHLDWDTKLHMVSMQHTKSGWLILRGMAKDWIYNRISE